MDPKVILQYVKQIVAFYKAKGIKPERMFYFPPYPPTGLMKAAVFVRAGRSLANIYTECLEVAE